MKKIVINGINGRVARAVAEAALARADCTVAAGMDREQAEFADFLVFPPSDYEGEADVIIDASSAEATEQITGYAVRRRLPLVIMTTGQTAEHFALINEAAKEIPVFISGNMSLGINILSKLAAKAAAVLAADFDIEIVEAHHNKKLDAPSGTALMLAGEIEKSLEEPAIYVYDRHIGRRARGKEEIGIHSIRGGTIIGEHSVIFAGEDEVITLSHSAGSRRMFALGAVKAALFIIGKKPGLYNMDDLLGDLF